MEIVNATAFKNHAYDYIKRATKFSEPIAITSKNGNAYLIGEDDYNSMAETLYLMNSPETWAEIQEASANTENPDYWIDAKDFWTESEVKN